MGVTDFVVKIEGFGEVWNARLVIRVALGSCLMHVVMAIGRRRTKAMITAVYVGFEVLVNVESSRGMLYILRPHVLVKECSGRRGGFKTALALNG